MSGYSAVQAELDKGTPAELLCATCPWDRLCVQPPQMTKGEIDRKLAEAQANDERRDPLQKQLPVGTLMMALTLAGRDSSGTLCPVFALRLRGPNGRDVADGVRAMMRDGVGGAS